MNIIDKIRIKANPNIIDKYPYDEEKLKYSIENGYKFNPNTILLYKNSDLFLKQYQKEIFDLIIKEFDEGKSISLLITFLDESNRLKILEERPEILSKESSFYYNYLDEIDEELILKYFDINVITIVNDKLMKIYSNNPDKLVSLIDKYSGDNIIDIIKNNIDKYFFYINDFKDKIKKELFSTVKEYALNNKIKINDKFPKMLLSDKDFLEQYLVFDPDYAKNLDGDMTISNELDIAKSIYKSDNILPYPVYDIYEKYDTIKAYIILKHKEFVNDVDKLYLAHSRCLYEEVYQYLKEANYLFDENTPAFLYNNEYVLKELLLKGVKFKEDVSSNILPMKEVFELFKQNYSIDDINKYTLFKDNSLIVEWGLKNGLPLEEVYDKYDINEFTELKNNTIVVKKPSIENINKVVLFYKSHPDLGIDKISIDIRDSYSDIKNDELVDYTDIQYLNSLKSTNINVTFLIGEEEKTLDEMILNEQLLEKVADEIKNSSLSSFEKFIATYDIVKMFKMYKDYGPGVTGRHIHSIMSGEYIVCAGYANLLENLLFRIGIPCTELGCTPSKNVHEGDMDGHARNYVYIKDPKYVIDGYYQCDATWENSNLYNYSHLLIRNDYAYDNHLQRQESDEIQQLCEGKASISKLKDVLKRLDPLLFEKKLSKQISDEEFLSEASSKLNKKVNLETILEAIKNTKKATFKNDGAVDFYMRQVSSLLKVCDFCSLEERIEQVRNVSLFRKQNSIDVESTTYGDVLNSNIFEQLNVYINNLEEEIAHKKMDYDYENKCIQFLAKKDDIEIIEYNKDKGTMDVYDEDYLVFTIPFELDPNLTIKEQAEYIINFVNPMELDVSNKKM